jgi:hypothetical protein
MLGALQTKDSPSRAATLRVLAALLPTRRRAARATCRDLREVLHAERALLRQARLAELDALMRHAGWRSGPLEAEATT